MNGSDVLERMAAGHVVPVVVVDDAGRARPLAEALVAGGLAIAEVTFRTAAAESALGAMVENESPCVGAGTVVSEEQVDRAIAAGACFIVSPGFSPAVVRRCHALSVPMFPGAATATELVAARDLGLSVVIFPRRTALRCGDWPPRSVGAFHPHRRDQR